MQPWQMRMDLPRLHAGVEQSGCARTILLFLLKRDLAKFYRGNPGTGEDVS